MKGKLVHPVVKSFKVAKVFREHNDKINCLDFSADGKHLVSSGKDDKIVIYNCESGIPLQSIRTSKFGVNLIRLTHAKDTAIHSSTKVDDSIRYLNMEENKYLSYFPGHTKKVISLSTSPVDDKFLTGSFDKTLRLWELGTPKCLGVINALTDRPIGSFDPQGLIFAVALNSEMIKLYDIRSYQKGPFSTFKFKQESTCDWTGLKFSPDGKYLLIGTNGNGIRMLDAFHGMPLQTFGGFTNKKGIPIEASFSPDTKYVFSGSADGVVHVWDADTGYDVCVLNGNHPGTTACVQFNPDYMMLASACTNLALWLPSEVPPFDE